MIRGKRLVVVDDSIVRGNTQRAQVRMLREAGAREVHVRISWPPVKWPCFYGIDFATRAELIANGLDVDEIAASIGADSLGYISLERLIEATTAAEAEPVPGLLRRGLPDRAARRELLGKHLLELASTSARTSTALGLAVRRWRRRLPRTAPDRPQGRSPMTEQQPPTPARRTPPPASPSRPATRPSS